MQLFSSQSRKRRIPTGGIWLLVLLIVSCSGGDRPPPLNPDTLHNPFAGLRGRGADGNYEIVDDVLSRGKAEALSYRIRYTKWAPVGTAGSGRVVIYNHGLQSHRGWFYPTANELATKGYTVYAFDRIGSGQSSHGLSSKRGEILASRGHIHDWHLFVETLHQMIELAARQNPGSEIFIWGNSYGAKVVTAFLLDHREKLEAMRVRGAIYTVPGLFQNTATMPLTFSKPKLLISTQDRLFPVPMTARNDDNGAGWFVSEGEWFDRIARDELSLRQATRSFWLQTAEMDRFIKKQSKRTPISIPVLVLMVEGDVMMDNIKMERFITERMTDHRYEFFSGGPEHKHFLLFSPDRNGVLGEIEAFLSP